MDQRTATLKRPRWMEALPEPRILLRWVYTGRVCVAIAVFLAAAFFYRGVAPLVFVIIATAALLSVLFSGGSLWYTEVSRRPPGQTFLYSQSLFDLALVTAVVHVTGGLDSDFASLYILVIAFASLLLPLASGLLITMLAGVLYFAEIFWFDSARLSFAVGLQVFVFVAVAVATGWIASRVQVVGAEREVLEREVRRLRLEAGDILRNLRSGVLTVYADGALAYANAAAEQLLGFDSDQFMGASVMEMLRGRSPEMAAAVERTLNEVVVLERLECQIQLEDRHFPIGLTTTRLDPSVSSVPTVTAIFTDISERKRLDELKLRNERLEAVAELSASLAHEIKNPLASIRSSVEQLSRSRSAGDDERFLAQLVVRESDRLSRLLTEFLDFSRVRVTRRSPVDLRSIAGGALEMVRGHPDCQDPARITLSGTDVVVAGDEDLLHRVIFNLVLNAVQAGGPTVDVSVEVRSARPGELPEGVHMASAAILRVRDTGPGIPAELRQRLFEPFVSGRVGGSGLGLAIVQRAVEAHDGMIFLETEPGKGTTFTVFLPRGVAVEEAA